MNDNRLLPVPLRPARGGLAISLYRAIWSRRAALVSAIHRGGHSLAWLYRRFPLPERVRAITAELVFHGIEHFIVQTEAYQQWLQQQQGGVSRLHVLLKSEPAPPAVPPVRAVTAEQWQQLLHLPPRHEVDAPLAVIVPVYEGYDETLSCFYQLLTSKNDTAFQLLVINDASPNRPLVRRLKALAQAGHCQLIEQERNGGFVESVNRGMREVAGKDVVLLNADTEVHPGWLDRLCKTLHAEVDIASATPLSNNAELCSYPLAFYHNPEPLEVSDAELNALAGQALSQHAPELPTAVGFCVALKAAALQQVGLFDARSFGKGYGEENDWCLRASGKGWRHVLCASVFVRHHGSVSFAGAKRRELNRSLRQLNKRHPHYRQLVREFRQSDPLLSTRRTLDLARIEACLQERPAILMISHNAGGGTERHINELTGWLEEEGIAVLRLSPDAKNPQRVRLWHPHVAQVPNLSYHLQDEQTALLAALHRCRIRHLHLHHLIGFPTGMPLFLMRYLEQSGLTMDATLHDYHLACPSINLLLGQDYMLREPTLAESQRWAQFHPTPAGRMPVWQWREAHRQLLLKARRIIAPSEDTATRMAMLMGSSLAIATQPHPQDFAGNAVTAGTAHRSGEPLNIAVIGRLVEHKGLQVLQQLAGDARTRRLPITYHIFGEADKEAALKKTGQVVLHGPYEEAEISERLRAARCHLALFPSVWPETFSYTLSIALQHRLYPVCYDIGAPAQRVREIGWGHILPRDWLMQPRRANDALLNLSITLPEAPLPLKTKAQQYPSILRDYYQLEWQVQP